MTTRERREAKAARLREWAEKREAKAEALDTKAHDMASVIPFGQPILAGHHSQGRDQRYRDRIAGTQDRAYENAKKAEAMNGRAASIEAALKDSIYTDDPDAIDALRARIAVNVAEAERIKAYNRSCRTGDPDLLLLDERQTATVESLRRFTGQLRANGSFPAYGLTNINARIRRDKKRLAELEGATDA